MQKQTVYKQYSNNVKLSLFIKRNFNTFLNAGWQNEQAHDNNNCQKYNLSCQNT